jgi:hypothetical protein
VNESFLVGVAACLKYRNLWIDGSGLGDKVVLIRLFYSQPKVKLCDLLRLGEEALDVMSSRSSKEEGLAVPLPTVFFAPSTPRIVQRRQSHLDCRKHCVTIILYIFAGSIGLDVQARPALPVGLS